MHLSPSDCVEVEQLLLNFTSLSGTYHQGCSAYADPLPESRSVCRSHLDKDDGRQLTESRNKDRQINWIYQKKAQKIHVNDALAPHSEKADRKYQAKQKTESESCANPSVMPDDMFGECERCKKGELRYENNQYGKMLLNILFH
jgi:hypothetical protein